MEDSLVPLSDERICKIRQINIEPSYAHGHLSNFFSNLVVVYENGDRQVLMQHIPNEEAARLAGLIIDEVEKIKQQEVIHHE